MANFIEVGKAGELDSGTMKKTIVQGHEILLARVGDNYYATDNLCPHLKGDLSQGTLEGTVVTCPNHSSQFDLTDGHVVRWLKGTGFVSRLGKFIRAPVPLTTYKIKIENDRIMIEI